MLTNVEVKKLLGAANNIRDKFLIQLLYETGLRIGEVLSLPLMISNLILEKVTK